MARKKVKPAYIVDDYARKATFKKRKKGILKKVSELVILCGIQACAIICNPFNFQTEVWPNPNKAKQVIESYQTSPVKDDKKHVNQESFIAKDKEKLNKQRKENHEKKKALDMYDYMEMEELPDDLTIEELEDMERLIDIGMKDIENKMSAIG